MSRHLLGTDTQRLDRTRVSSVEHRLIRMAALLLACAVPFLALGCALVSHGTTEVVTAASDPQDADVYVNGARVASTPCTLQLARKNAPVAIRFEKPDYHPAESQLERRIHRRFFDDIILLLGGAVVLGLAEAEADESGWDLLGGTRGPAIIAVGLGIVGALTDLSTGAAYRHEPPSLSVTLSRIASPDD